MYWVDVTTSFDEFWRYNVIIVGAGFDESGSRLYFEHCRSVLNSDIRIDGRRRFERPTTQRPPLELECGEASLFRLFVYVVMHTEPEDMVIEETPVFPLRIVVARHGEVIYDREHEVNQWGGCDIEINF